jgi:hypothetical protein
MNFSPYEGIGTVGILADIITKANKAGVIILIFINQLFL